MESRVAITSSSRLLSGLAVRADGPNNEVRLAVGADIEEPDSPRAVPIEVVKPWESPALGESLPGILESDGIPLWIRPEGIGPGGG